MIDTHSYLIRFRDDDDPDYITAQRQHATVVVAKKLAEVISDEDRKVVKLEVIRDMWLDPFDEVIGTAEEYRLYVGEVTLRNPDIAAYPPYLDSFNSVELLGALKGRLGRKLKSLFHGG